jgi:N-acyl-D-amino-acid deacylase
MSPDVLLRGGVVIDGTGRADFAGDVAVVGDRIDYVGALDAVGDDCDAVDVSGLCVAPGFIDVHTHSDFTAFAPEGSEVAQARMASVRQGVTTEICGNCGFSPFPATAPRLAEVDHQIRTLFGAGSRGYASLAEFSDAIDGRALGANLAVLAGHGTIRAGVMGFDRRSPSQEELRTMQRLLDESLDQGALGLSSGLIYPPGVYADIAELASLAQVAARHGRPYTTHMRSETDRVVEAVEEALAVARSSGAAVQISHHKTAGKRNWGRSEQTLELISRARDDGVDVMLDVYPYTAGSTLLYALLPPWVNDGGIEAMLGRVGSESARRQIERDYDEGIDGWEDLAGAASWDGVVIASASGHPEHEGKDVATLAAARGIGPVDLVCDLLTETRGSVIVVVHMMAEEDVRRILASPLAMVGSDGMPSQGRPHPRWAGSFARVLGVYVRDERLLSLESAVHKMTGMPADRFGLNDRGVLATGRRADIVVFDPDAVGDTATYSDPLAPPEGVVHVVVNGAFEIRDGAPTGAAGGTFVTAERA